MYSCKSPPLPPALVMFANMKETELSDVLTLHNLTFLKEFLIGSKLVHAQILNNEYQQTALPYLANDLSLQTRILQLWQ